jgi:predicted alpha/beta hydrolase family esterase
VIVIVHGWDGSGEGHWQRWLEAELRARGVRVAFPALPAPTAPAKDAWVAALAAARAAAGGAPVTFVCHSLGCWALDHLVAEQGAAGIRAALLAAPPSPLSLFEPIQSFLPPPRRRDAWAPLAARTLVVGGDDDEQAAPEELEETARLIGARCRILPGAGHLNVAAGYGPWPFALEWLRGVGAL